VTRRIWSYPRQHETHRELLGRPRPGAWRSSGAVQDAIVVPASRPAENLEHVVSLAQATRCQLVVLCSLDAHSADVWRLLKARHFTEATVVDVPPGYRHSLLDFETSRLARQVLPRGCANPNGDLSTKRNLGLLLARMVGWERIVFMDDDIREVKPADLAATVSMLDRYTVAGMRVIDFPDNSVVCHARRKAGEKQDVFVTGSVLGVNCARPVGFFPEIYNEDWFFFYDDARAGRVGCSQRYARQLNYDPFGNPRRARQQEFGDVLAEGLYALIHKNAGPEEATWDYWTDFIAARRKLIEEIKKGARSLLTRDRGKVISALEGAIASLMKIQPWACEIYVSTWQHDLETWQCRLAEVAQVDSVEAALSELDLKQDAGSEIVQVPLHLPAPRCNVPAPHAGSESPLTRQVAAVTVLVIGAVMQNLTRPGNLSRRKG
jgi:hypothetical protein